MHSLILSLSKDGAASSGFFSILLGCLPVLSPKNVRYIHGQALPLIDFRLKAAYPGGAEK
jgi:hypothetical protein